MSSIVRSGSSPLSRIFDVRDYSAVGNGTTDDTAAIQAALNVGGNVHIPDGFTFKLTDQLTMSVAGTRLTGHGKMSWASGVTNLPAIAVTADGCVIEGCWLDNPNQLQATTGGRNYGISAAASEFRASRNRIEHFQNGIAVRATGEFQNIIIDGNRIKDVIGCGGGAADTTTSVGEDRGDGIVCWGAQATITGNVVNALSGTDARVGIHCESLAGSEVTAAAHSDAMCTVTGNVVYGQFRRNAVFEGMTSCVVTGNTFADATWWNVAVITGSRSCVITDNTLLYTRTSGDNQGGHWFPVRTPIMIYGDAQNSRVADNTIIVSGVADCYIAAQGTDGSNMPINTTIDDNTCTLAGSGSATNGIITKTIASKTKVRRNLVEGFTTKAVWLYGCADFEVRDNLLDGLALTPTNGVYSESCTAGGTVADNRIRNISGSAVGLNSHTSPVIVTGNVLSSVTTGINLFGCTGGGSIQGNFYASSVTTKTSNIDSAILRDAVPGVVEVFSTGGTWTPDTAARTFLLQAIGGGGSGGSGACSASGTVAYGGGGGSGASATQIEVPIGTITSSTYTVTVGAGGAAPATTTSTSVSGASGNAGGSSSITGLLIARGGNAGSGGTTTTGTGGNAVTGQISSGAGGSGNAAAVGGSSTATGGPPSGGAGGAYGTGGVSYGGGSGFDSFSNVTNTTSAGGSSPGGAGATGASRANPAFLFGRPGGGGGGGDASTAAGAGGAGGLYGAGGGGGGGNVNGHNGGAGGAGADGLVIVMTRY